MLSIQESDPPAQISELVFCTLTRSCFRMAAMRGGFRSILSNGSILKNAVLERVHLGNPVMRLVAPKSLAGNVAPAHTGSGVNIAVNEPEVKSERTESVLPATAKSVENQKQRDESGNKTLAENTTRVFVKASVESEVSGVLVCEAGCVLENLISFLDNEVTSSYPNVGVKPEFYDAMLNGLEIFKLGDGKANLAGPNPELSDLMIKQQEHNNKKFAEGKSYTSAIIGGAAGGAATFGIMAALIFVAQNRKKRHPGDHSMSSWLPLHGHSQTSATTISGRSNGSTTISSDAAANCRFFSLAEIKKATKNCDESHVIGVGGFGKVYKGVIDGDMKVAIKRSNPS
ncbi:hypothetical protein POM88_021732 [Heracleum sosnowskyi]|uniref:Uncharacterized protein n=1 Tax=Heracleum sosnowskyi TaxID=360622 RepID=A0AAD8IGF3_9APIA|nr:hypothetical protein POM88_021732 [Heracleum sosnowskyi]